MRPSAAALVLLLLPTGGPATAGVLGDEDLVALFSDLPMAFEVRSAEEGEQGRTVRLRSTEPTGEGAAGDVYLRATVTIASLGDTAAGYEIRRRLAAADPDIGLSYAWDYVAADDGTVVHLHADCTFSEKSFRSVARALARQLAGAGAAPAESFWCRCGGRCRSGAPFPLDVAAGPQGRRLPAVDPCRPTPVKE